MSNQLPINMISPPILFAEQPTCHHMYRQCNVHRLQREFHDFNARIRSLIMSNQIGWFPPHPNWIWIRAKLQGPGYTQHTFQGSSRTFPKKRWRTSRAIRLVKLLPGDSLFNKQISEPHSADRMTYCLVISNHLIGNFNNWSNECHPKNISQLSVRQPTILNINDKGKWHIFWSTKQIQAA